MVSSFQILLGGIHTITNTNDNGVGSLRHTIIMANSNDTIRFNQGITATGNDTIFLDSTISTNKSLTIIGNRTSLGELYISGKNLCRVFEIACSGNFYFDSINIIEGFENVSAHGGGIYFTGDTLTVNYSQFRNNYARAGGAISATKLIITKSNLQYNEARLRGAAINSTLFCSIKDCSIMNNIGLYGWQGFIINAGGHLEIIATFITSNTHSSTSGNGSTVEYGGSSTDELFITNSVIYNNAGYGLVVTGNPKVEILKSRFNNNEKGGANINTNGDVYIKYTHFNDNQTKGGLQINGLFHNVILDNIVVKNNTIPDYFGGGLSTSGNDTLLILNSIIDSNKSGFYGGGGILSARYIKIHNSKIQGNESDIHPSLSGANRGGSGFKISSNNVDISYTTFNGNYSDTSDNNTYRGGAILMNFLGADSLAELNLNINACTFNNNVSHYASAINMGIEPFTSLKKATCNLTIKNSTFTENASKETSCIVVWTGSVIENHSSISIGNSTIYNNYGNGEGIVTSYSNSPTGIHTSKIKVKSSIIAFNDTSNFYTDSVISNGYNLFSDASLISNHTTDQLGVSISSLNLGVLQQNGGITYSLLPQTGSIAIDTGTPTDFSDAQNGSVIDSRRDIGACELGAGVGIPKKQINNNIIMYPNPTSDNVTLKFKERLTNIRIRLFDVSGRIILQKENVNSSSIILETESLKKGVYLIQITSNRFIKTKQLIKL